MTKLTAFDDCPTDVLNNVLIQALKHSETTKVYDLGDITQYIEKKIPNDIYNEYRKGLDILLQVISDKYSTSNVEVKLVVSHIEK